MPVTPVNPFKGHHYSGEVILLAVRWYLRYSLAYEHVAEMLSERGLEVDASCNLAMAKTGTYTVPLTPVGRRSIFCCRRSAMLPQRTASCYEP